MQLFFFFNFFKLAPSGQGKKAEAVFYAHTEDNLQLHSVRLLPSKATVTAFPAGAGTSALSRQQTTTNTIVKF